LPGGIPCTDRRLLTRQLRSILAAAHLPVKRNEIVVMPRGYRVHFTFVQKAGRPVVVRNGVATFVEREDQGPEDDLADI
jgi:homogentisate 1,2-dioxygenase